MSCNYGNWMQSNLNKIYDLFEIYNGEKKFFVVFK